METDIQRIAERSLRRMLWLLRGGRYFFLVGGLAYFLWEAASALAGREGWALDSVVLVFFVSITAPTLLWLTGSWVERLAKEVNWRYAEILAVNRMAQTVVTERAELVTNLKRSQIQLRMLQTVNHVLVRPQPASVMVEKILDVILNSLEVDASELWLITSDQNGIRLQTHRGLFPDVFSERPTLAFGEDLPGSIAQSRAPVVSTDLRNDGRLVRDAVYRTGFVSYLGVPLLSEDSRLIGVLGAVSRTERQFADGEVEALLDIGAGLASIARPLIHVNGQENADVVFLRPSGTG